MEEKIIEWIRKESLESMTAEDRQGLEAWRREDADNEAAYQAYRRIWMECGFGFSGPRPDAEQAWDRFAVRHRINSPKFTVRPLLAIGWRVAAALVLTAGIALWWFNHQVRPAGAPLLELVASTDRTQFRLDDGTEVSLRPESRLTVLEMTGHSGERRVILDGEAFFHVSRDTVHPFIIQADHATVQVLGTSFHVRTDLSALEVVVKEGRVAVTPSPEAGRTELSAGQRLSFDRQTREVLVDLDRSGNAWAWQSGILQFQGTPLADVVRTIEHQFGIRVKLSDPDLGQCPFSSRFDRADPLTVLKSIAGAFDMNLRQSPEGIYYLTDGRCHS